MKLLSVQYLRAVAATAVVVTHASTSLFEGKGALIPFELGAAGVDLFFVISGFYTTANDPPSPSQFLARRMIRIVPLYAILTTAAFLLAAAWPTAVRTLSDSPWDYVRSILFVPFYNEKVLHIRP